MWTLTNENGLFFSQSVNERVTWCYEGIDEEGVKLVACVIYCLKHTWMILVVLQVYACCGYLVVSISWLSVSVLCDSWLVQSLGRVVWESSRSAWSREQRSPLMSCSLALLTVSLTSLERKTRFRMHSTCYRWGTHSVTHLCRMRWSLWWYILVELKR